MAIPGIERVSWGVSSNYIEIDSIWEGTGGAYNLIWQPWFFTDHFDRSTIGPNWVSTGGIFLTGSELMKNNSNGSADTWTVRNFPTDDLQVVTTLGSVGDKQQRSAIALGSPDEYVFCEFAVNGGIIGDYDGQTWRTRSNIQSMSSMKKGDTIEVRRLGNSIQFLYNGMILSSTSSNYGRGVGKRRVNLSVRRDSNFFGTYYSPAFDEVKIGRYKL